MKIKFGDMTINQTIEVCKRHYRGSCNGCPLYHENWGCIACVPPYSIKLGDLQDREIELPEGISSANAAPVIHGHWIVQRKMVYLSSTEYPLRKPTPLWVPDFYNCSVCGRREKYEEPYCHCGAKMDEEVKQ